MRFGWGVSSFWSGWQLRTKCSIAMVYWGKCTFKWWEQKVGNHQKREMCNLFYGFRGVSWWLRRGGAVWENRGFGDFLWSERWLFEMEIERLRKTKINTPFKSRWAFFTNDGQLFMIKAKLFIKVQDQRFRRELFFRSWSHFSFFDATLFIKN